MTGQIGGFDLMHGAALSSVFGRRGGRAVAAGVSGLLVLAAMAAVSTPARADTTPDPGTPATVSADPLPTVQQNGVVWSQVTVGNTVYATGSFSQTYPAGATSPQTPRGNLLAYDITTGNLTSFNHVLNAQGLTITATPDGSRVIVGGGLHVGRRTDPRPRGGLHHSHRRTRSQLPSDGQQRGCGHHGDQQHRVHRRQFRICRWRIAWKAGRIQPRGRQPEVRGRPTSLTSPSRRWCLLPIRARWSSVDRSSR